MVSLWFPYRFLIISLWFPMLSHGFLMGSDGRFVACLQEPLLTMIINQLAVRQLATTSGAKQSPTKNGAMVTYKLLAHFRGKYYR